MYLGEYQELAVRTAADGEIPAGSFRILNASLGLSGEVGEFNELIKKHIFHGQPLDKDKLAKELGDVLWYVAAAAEAMGFDLSAIAANNIAKLRARYPDGFSSERSTVREGMAE